MIYPQYRLPPHLALSILGDALRGRTRSFRQDASELARGISSWRVLGQVPALENCRRGWLVTVNHYFRPGFGGWWIGVAVAAAFSAEMHWVMTSAWTYPDGLRSRTITPATRWLFRRLAQLTILPVGLFEEEGALCLRFGSPYNLPADLPRNPETRDREVAARVIEAIAGCLPPAFWTPRLPLRRPKACAMG